MAAVAIKEPRLHIRWMIRRDMADVQRIEESSFEFPWSEEDFVKVLRQRNAIGMVAIDEADRGKTEGRIVGFMAYELLSAELHVLNFAVDKPYRRRGIGRAMVEKLVSKLSYGRRDRIMVEVRETNLDALLFFKAHQFRAIDILRGYYQECRDRIDEDAILMQFKYYPTEADVDWAYQRNAKLQ